MMYYYCFYESYEIFGIYFIIFMRAIQAIFLSSTTVVGIGVITDVYPKEIRGYAMGWFSILALLGNSIGPLIGGLVEWKIIFIVLSLIGFVMLVLVSLMPETHNENLVDTNNISIVRKYVEMIVIAFSTKDLFFIIFFRTLCMTIFYLLMYQIPIVLSRNYEWSQMNIGLTMIPIGISMIISGVIGGKISDVLPRLISSNLIIDTSNDTSNDTSYEPRYRLIPCILSGLFLPILFVSFGIMCTIDPYISICISIFASMFVSLSRSGILSYCIEMNQDSASSISACLGSFQFIFLFIILLYSPEGMNILGYPIFNQIISYSLIISLLPILFVIFRK